MPPNLPFHISYFFIELTMEPNCVQFLHNKTILVTGASGFLAKVFVEKILRVQPNVKKLYLLVRAPTKESAMQRLRIEVLEKDLFRVLKKDLGDENLNKFVSEKVVPVPGDISMDDLGVDDFDLRQQMWEHIDVVVNVAGNTNFDERYDIALGINTFGALNVLNFAKNCVKPQLLLHVSTAYVCGEKSGLLLEKSLETLNGNGKLDINAEMELMRRTLKELHNRDCSEDETADSLKDLGMKRLIRARLHGWPNTYVFTKAMGEMLLGDNRGSMPLVIVRPSMITSTFSEPFPGWIEGLRTIDSVIVAYGKGKLKCFLGDPNSVFDLIPVDMVANAMVVAAAAHKGDPEAHMVYHVGSSCQNPFILRQLPEFAARYFRKNPLIGRDGSPVVVSHFTILSTMARFTLFVTLCYKLPLQLLWLINVIYPRRYGDKYEELDRKIRLVMRMIELYKPYVLFKGIFDDINSQRLRLERKEELFNFDPKCIDWEDYMINTHIPGVITHVLKK
ncbi:PREDICTED: fatty acyl-CoA reductase 1-like isoform X2 [Tarenaya hassleriana]|uniref:fatty acyl-CoA reductase 1-like isoform X2 n=1 Tax=Tarenaya hassleriana TaxID=28532 RepID=UPI00053C5720|nr:PREDICTED: fatty acyl-CoA reductase 1-like isoform X2 [Tarenaya hassleriana]